MRFALFPRTTLAVRECLSHGNFHCVAVPLLEVLVAIMADIIIDTVGSLIGATSASFPDDRKDVNVVSYDERKRDNGCKAPS